MIEYINKIENYGIFLKHGKSPALTRHTTIYGWNGSGKTTLSKLLAELGMAVKSFPQSKYKVTIGGSDIDQSLISDQGIVVFNEDYVRENSPSVFDVSEASKHIFSIGKESKDLAEEIKNDEEEKTRLDKLLNKKDEAGAPSIRDQHKEKIKQYEKIFTDIARTISASSTGVAARNYRSDKAKAAFERIDEQKDIDDDLIEKLKKRASQEAKDNIDEMTPGSALKRLKDAYGRSSTVALRKIVRSVIAELEKTQERSDWALSGFNIHKHSKLKKCLFCGSNIKPDRWSDLESFFNEEYQTLHDEVVSIRDELREVYGMINMLTPPNQSLFYQDMQDGYSADMDEFEKAKNNLLDQIKACGQQINTKLQNLNSEVKISKIDCTDLELKLSVINKKIQQHNHRSNNIDKDKEEAFTELESQYLRSIYDETTEIVNERDDLGASIDTLENDLKKLEKNIEVNQAKIRNSHLGCEKINEILHRTLGRNDLELRDEIEGYKIYRGDELAKGLSEGERAIITLSYFLAYITIDDKRLKKTIVVIDDPISSLDIDMIHKVFAAIKSKLTKAKQLIILTHNFEALNQIKKWYKSDGESQQLYSLLMIRNGLQNKRRCAYIESLDPTLENYETEYHYLFNRLVVLREELKGGEDPELAQVYDYPNIARKVVECYLSFKVPSGKSLSTNLRLLRQAFKDHVSTEMVEDIKSFINSGSHLDSKTGLLQFDASLTKNIKHYVDSVLSLVELTDQMHYKMMVK